LENAYFPSETNHLVNYEGDRNMNSTGSKEEEKFYTYYELKRVTNGSKRA